MMLAYSTNAFVQFTLVETIERIAAIGYEGLEIMCDRPHLYPPDFDADDLAAVTAALDRTGLKVTNLNGFTLFAVGDTYLPSWIEPDAARREIRIRHTLDCIRIARQIGCENVSIPPGGPLNGMDRNQALALFHKGLEQVIPLAEELKINLLVEPEPDLLIERTSEFLPFIRDVQSPVVGLNFDIGHFYCVGEDPSAAFSELYEWVRHVHLEDIADTRVHRHLIPGHGAIPFEKVIRTMKELGYDGDICVELYPYTDEPEAAGRESLDYLKRLPIEW